MGAGGWWEGCGGGGVRDGSRDESRCTDETLMVVKVR
jgi:hypothetical protein